MFNLNKSFDNVRIYLQSRSTEKIWLVLRGRQIMTNSTGRTGQLISGALKFLAGS